MAGMFSQVSEDFEAVHLGHHVIEEDEVGYEGGNFFQCLGPVVGALDAIVLVLEFLLQQIEIERFVIDNENSVWHGSPYLITLSARTSTFGGIVSSSA